MIFQSCIRKGFLTLELPKNTQSHSVADLLLVECDLFLPFIQHFYSVPMTNSFTIRHSAKFTLCLPLTELELSEVTEKRIRVFLTFQCSIQFRIQQFSHRLILSDLKKRSELQYICAKALRLCVILVEESFTVPKITVKKALIMIFTAIRSAKIFS